MVALQCGRVSRNYFMCNLTSGNSQPALRTFMESPVWPPCLSHQPPFRQQFLQFWTEVTILKLPTKRFWSYQLLWLIWAFWTDHTVTPNYSKLSSICAQILSALQANFHLHWFSIEIHHKEQDFDVHIFHALLCCGWREKDEWKPTRDKTTPRAGINIDSRK